MTASTAGPVGSVAPEARPVTTASTCPTTSMPAISPSPHPIGAMRERDG